TVAPRQQTAVDFRVQRFDPTVEDFGGAGVLRDLGDFDTGVGKQACRTSCREDTHAAAGKGLRKVDDARFVGHRYESGLDFHELSVMDEEIRVAGHEPAVSCARCCG